MSVKIVVDETFKDIVENRTNDVFIAFCQAQCPYCLALEPKWKSLAEGRSTTIMLCGLQLS